MLANFVPVWNGRFVMGQNFATARGKAKFGRHDRKTKIVVSGRETNFVVTPETNFAVTTATFVGCYEGKNCVCDRWQLTEKEEAENIGLDGDDDVLGIYMRRPGWVHFRNNGSHSHGRIE